MNTSATINEATYTASGIFARIKNALRSWRNSRQAAQANDRARELKWRFAVKERDGRIFLTCDGVAFQEIDPSATAGTICELLTAARLNAQAYNNINH